MGTCENQTCPTPPLVDDLSMWRIQTGFLRSFLSGSPVYSLRKSARNCALVASRGWNYTLNALSSMAYFIILPEASGFYKVVLNGMSIKTVIGWASK